MASHPSLEQPTKKYNTWKNKWKDVVPQNYRNTWDAKTF